MSKEVPGEGGRVAVVGGGLAGLSAAYRLRALGFEPLLFEQRPNFGGVVQSFERDGYLIDLGPNTLVARSSLLPDLISELDLGGHVVRASPEANRRYVVRNGVPHPLPTGPAALVATPLLSTRAKLRLLAEPFVRRGAEGRAETVADFVRRRLGEEVLAYAVDPFVGGIFAGDPERLSVRHAFPLLSELERDHGSLARGLIQRLRAARKAETAPVDRSPFSFRGGMQCLPDAIAETLSESAVSGSSVGDVVADAGAFVVHSERNGMSKEHRVRAVVIALPPQAAADFTIVGERLRTKLMNVPMPPVTVMALGFRRHEVGHPLDGFGLLVPGAEPYRILGCLFSSSLFPGRAPEGHVLITCFVGGRRHPEDGTLSADAQVDLVMNDLRRLLDVSGEPVLVERKVWPQAIPQYENGHESLLTELSKLETECPGLAIAGSMRCGVSVGDTIGSGYAAAERIATVLTT